MNKTIYINNEIIRYNNMTYDILGVIDDEYLTIFITKKRKIAFLKNKLSKRDQMILINNAYVYKMYKLQNIIHLNVKSDNVIFSLHNGELFNEQETYDIIESINLLNNLVMVK